MIACPRCKAVGPEGAAYCQHCGAAMKRRRMVTRPVPTMPAVPEATAKSDPGWWGRQSNSTRGALFLCAVAAVIVLLWVGAATGVIQTDSTQSAGNTSSSSSSGGSSLQWLGAENELYDPVHSYDAAVTAGNVQGALTAKTTIIRHCQDYASLRASGSQEETAVRGVCARVGQPLP